MPAVFPPPIQLGAGKPFFNVLDFGAKGDGTTDDSDAIAAAMAAASAYFGGVVWFPALSFRVTRSFVVPPSVSWSGAAPTQANQLGSAIVWDAGYVGGAALVTMRDLGGLTDLHFYPQAGAPAVLPVVVAAGEFGGSTFRGCTFENTTAGVRIYGLAWFERCLFLNVTLAAGHTGIIEQGAAVDVVSIRDCTIDGDVHGVAGARHVSLGGAGNCSVTGNRFVNRDGGIAPAAVGVDSDLGACAVFGNFLDSSGGGFAAAVSDAGSGSRTYFAGNI